MKLATKCVVEHNFKQFSGIKGHEASAGGRYDLCVWRANFTAANLSGYYSMSLKIDTDMHNSS